MPLRRWLRRLVERFVAPSPDVPDQTRSAVSSSDTELDLSPDDPQLNYQAAVAALDGGDAEHALDLFRLARHYAPSSFIACLGEIRALRALGREAAVPATMRQFLDTNPYHPGAIVELAGWLYGQGQFDAVEQLLVPVTSGDRIIPEACNLLGLMLGRDLGRLDESRELLQRAVAGRPGWPAAECNLGWMLTESGEHERGFALLDDILDRYPDDHEVRLIRSHANLKRGEFAAGWSDYGARHRSRHAVPRPYRFPSWTGEPVPGARLLVYAEQGLGDHIMFASCVPDACALTEHVVLECHPKLVKLFKRSFPDTTVIPNVPEGAAPAWLESVDPVDLQVAMGDLPGFFRRRWSDFPRHMGYLRPDPRKVRAWKSRLADIGGGPKIGLSWRGGTQATRTRLRSLSAEDLAPLLGRDATFISLQYGETGSDLDALDRIANRGLVHWPEALDDYDDTAALVSALDGVVSVCTALIHLCGALGRHAWVLVPAAAEWRYLGRGEHLPWYPALELLRQRTPGDWGETIGDLLCRIDARRELRRLE